MKKRVAKLASKKRSRHLDWDRAAKIAGFRGEEADFLFLELSAVYLVTAPEIVRILKQMAEEENFQGIQEASHRLKGMSAQIGGYLLANLCETMETHSFNRTHFDVHLLMKQVSQEFDALCSEILNRTSKGKKIA